VPYTKDTSTQESVVAQVSLQVSKVVESTDARSPPAWSIPHSIVKDFPFFDVYDLPLSALPSQVNAAGPEGVGLGDVGASMS
jgi:hypothetical protein